MVWIEIMGFQRGFIKDVPFSELVSCLTLCLHIASSVWGFQMVNRGKQKLWYQRNKTDESDQIHQCSVEFPLPLMVKTGKILKLRKSEREGNSSGSQAGLNRTLHLISTSRHLVNIWKGKHSVTSIFDPYTYQSSSFFLLYFKGRRILSSETCALKSSLLSFLSLSSPFW